MSDIRTNLAIPTEPWERAKSRFLEGLSEEEQSNFRSATLETIYYEAEVVHRGHQQTSKLHACRQKLRPLLDILEAYGKGLDVISNTGMVSMVMAPLWGSIRVALQIAQGSTEMFENIVDMLIEIGNTLPHFRDYERLFPDHERLLVAISDAYLIIIYFCTDVKNLFRAAKKSKRSKISITLACKSAWKPFTEKFHEYLRDFKKIQSRIDTEARKADMIEAKHERQRQEDHRTALIRFNKKERLRESLRRISPCDYKGHHRRIQELRHPGTATWLFDNQHFQEWLCTPSSSSFGCFGIPGSGKTILSSSVIDHLASTQQSSVLCYHYCSYDYPSSLKATAILGTFLRQILEREMHSAAIEDSLHEDLHDVLETPIPRELFSVISKYFKAGDKYFFLIDGLDELPHSEQAELAAVVEKGLTGAAHCTVKIFFSCRPEAMINKKAFRAIHSVTISPQNLYQDIKTFVEAVVDEKLNEGDLELGDPHLKYEIIDQLATGAKEMFLWVKFQIDEICEAVSDEGIRRTLENLPKDLISTYTRIIQRISASSGGRAKLEIVGKVFRWLVCAKRPLKIEELKVAIALEPTDISMPTARIPSDDGSKVIRACSNLVVLSKADRTVRLAHHTVRQFILLQDDERLGPERAPSDDDSAISTEAGPIPRAAYIRHSKMIHFSLSDAECDIGELCLTFLHFSEFETQIQVGDADHTNLQMTGGMVDTLLQGIAPSSGFPGQALAYLRGGGVRGIDDTRNVTLVLPKAKRYATKHEPLFEQYPLLQYIAAYWPLHLDRFRTSDLDDRDQRIYAMVLRIATDKTFLLPVRPWEDPKYTQVGMERQQTLAPDNSSLFSWVLENGSDYLWRQFFCPMKASIAETRALEKHILFEMQSNTKERDVIVRAASGGSALILEDLIRCLNQQAYGVIPVDVLYRAIAVSSDAAAYRLVGLLHEYGLKVAQGQPQPEKKSFWQARSDKSVSWLKNTWPPENLCSGPTQILRLLSDKATKEYRDNGTAERVRTMLLTSGVQYLPRPFPDRGNFRVDVLGAGNLPASDCSDYSDPYCVFVFNGITVFTSDKQKHNLRPAWNEHFEVMVTDRRSLEFKVEVWDWDFADKHECLGSAAINLDALEPFQQQEVTLGLEGKSGAIRLKMMFMPEVVA